MIYQPHQQRVVDEYSDLFEKTTKLGLLFGTPTFANLDPLEQGRLNRQWQVMQQYRQILSERIAAFK